MDDPVKAVARAWAGMDGKPYGEGYDVEAEELLRRSGLANRSEELEAKLAKAVEALEWYEKQTRLSATSTDHQADHAEQALDCDRGARARAALAEQEKDDE